MKDLSFKIMSLLAQQPGLFNAVMSGDPKDAYDKAGVALETFICLNATKEHHDEAKQLLEEYMFIKKEIEQMNLEGAHNQQLLFSYWLCRGGKYITDDLLDQAQAEGTIVEEVTPMENLSLRIMSLLGHHKALFKMITSSNPSEAYDKAGQALILFISFETVKAHHEEAKALLKEYRNMGEELEKESVEQANKQKALMSKYLWDAGHFLVKTGAFGVDNASILGLFTARMAAHIKQLKNIWSKCNVMPNVYARNQSAIYDDSIERLIEAKVKILKNSLIDEIQEEFKEVLIEDTRTKFMIEEKVIEDIKSKVDISYLEKRLTNEVIKNIKDGVVDPYNIKHLKNHEVRKKLIETFYIAEEEIDIISPWIADWVLINQELINGFTYALNKGVNIKIIFGMGNGKNSNGKGIDKRYWETLRNSRGLEEKFSGYKGKIILKQGNTHEKMLLCDDKYLLQGSYNLLSFKGDYSSSSASDESMKYIEHKLQINFLREEYFNFDN